MNGFVDCTIISYLYSKKKKSHEISRYICYQLIIFPKRLWSMCKNGYLHTFWKFCWRLYWHANFLVKSWCEIIWFIHFTSFLFFFGNVKIVFSGRYIYTFCPFIILDQSNLFWTCPHCFGLVRTALDKARCKIGFQCNKGSFNSYVDKNGKFTYVLPFVT